ncbi:hypothetical protein BAE44_0012759 [Dichanthelium oligosanthes]|uniref:DUF7595 domain-containing protein n=1 Tax=Dichanthelium oligosanthes TaxID=888268 RepID=A0A1E5VM69_9POAL|nr:hypothetical protein BAE44_0012759 [Dichanthelium oligosanthes]
MPRDDDGGGQLDHSRHPFIPTDLLIEIFARSDTKTIVRGAATCKPILRAILDPYFHSSTAASRPALAPAASTPPSSSALPACSTESALAISFQLLVAGTNLVTTIFSFELGDWGDVVHTHLPLNFIRTLGDWGDVVHTHLPLNFIRTLPNRLSPPLILGTTVHWLCKERGIVALDVTAAPATVIELPPKCFSQVVIQRQAIGMVVRFLPFGERNGTVMLQMEEVGLVQIDLGSREALVLSDKFKKNGGPSLAVAAVLARDGLAHFDRKH